MGAYKAEIFILGLITPQVPSFSSLFLSQTSYRQQK
jgi:hypothetical protein